MTWIDQLLAHPLQRQALARTLRLVRIPSSGPVKPGVRRMWFRGTESYFDVFVDVRDGDVVWCQFTLRGMSLTWNPKTNRLQTDLTNEMGTADTALSSSRLLYGIRSDAASRFTLLVLLMLEQSSEEPLFADVAQQLRQRMLEPNTKKPASLQMAAT